jgi:hypothetical protein
LQVEVDLWLKDPDPDRAGLDSAADIGQEIVGVADSKGDAEALKVGPQSTPIAGQVRLARRRRIVRPL